MPLKALYTFRPLAKTFLFLALTASVSAFIFLPYFYALFTLPLALLFVLLLIIYDWIIPKKHDRSKKNFTEGSYQSVHLTYENELPVALIECKNFYQTGFDTGYLLARPLQKLFFRWNLVVKAIYSPQDARTIKATIPEQYLDELAGMADGANKALGKQFLTQDKLLLFHLLGDALHFHPHSKIPFGCSMVVTRNANGHPQFYRNMDWPSLGVIGSYSLVVKRKLQNVKTCELGLPGIIGTITGINCHGLCLAMSVCKGKTDTIRGMPSLLFNRYLLDHCKKAADIKTILQTISPLGAYNLMAVDPEEAFCFHFYQNEDGSHYIQELKNEPLIVTNCRYSQKVGAHDNYFCSLEREAKIRHFFTQKKEAGVELLGLSLVNNIETCHSAIIDPSNRTMCVAFDNAYAASSPFSKISWDA